MMILIPAYGRDYKSGEEISRDFMANKDFKISSVPHMGKFCNREDIVKNEAEVKVRYKKGPDGQHVEFVVLNTTTGEYK